MEFSLKYKGKTNKHQKAQIETEINTAINKWIKSSQNAPQHEIQSSFLNAVYLF